MGYIWLRYQNGVTIDSERIRPTRCTSEIETKGIEQTSLSDIEYSHFISDRTVWSLVFAPDSLTYQFNFMVEFWRAKRWWIAEVDSSEMPADESFIEVVIPRGRMPIEYVNNNKGLRRMSFDARQKKPNPVS
jgi:hypothetical protein